MLVAFLALTLSLGVLGSGVVTLLKGQYFLAALGLVLCGLPWIVGAVVPAAPGSRWDRRFPPGEDLGPVAQKASPDALPDPRIW